MSKRAQRGEAFNELDWLVEDRTKVASRAVGERFKVGQRFPIGDFPFETCHRAIRDAAGIDERKVA